MPNTPSPLAGTGILSVWNDIAPEMEAFYERWYMSEHFPERLGVPGFLRGRRYVAIDADRKYFTFYDLADSQVLFSAPYLARMNAPTPWTQKVMTAWSGMFRTACERIARTGSGNGGHSVGGFVMVARWETPVTLPGSLAGEIHEKLADPAVVAVDLWRANAQQNASTVEARTRPAPDRTIAGALIVETTAAASVTAAKAALPRLLGSLAAPAAIGLYQLIALQDGRIDS